MLCKCGCKTKLRKDNKTGWAKAHKPCTVCGQPVKRSDTECCSKSCSAKLHWQRHPEMKESRSWNKDRAATRSKNPKWRENLGASRKKAYQAGKWKIWCDGTKGLVKAWNKGIPHSDETRAKISAGCQKAMDEGRWNPCDNLINPIAINERIDKLTLADFAKVSAILESGH